MKKQTGWDYTLEGPVDKALYPNIEEGAGDLAECKSKICLLLKEYNCDITGDSQWHGAVISDNDTDEAINIG